MELWIARDKNGDISLYDSKPTLICGNEFVMEYSNSFCADIEILNGHCKLFDDLTFENSPKQVELKIID